MDKQRLLRLLIEKVMEWQAYDDYDSFYAAGWSGTGPGVLRMERKYPVAWWDPHQNCYFAFYDTETDAKPFDLTWEGMRMVVAKLKEKGWDFNLAQVGPIFTATFSRTLGPTMSEAFTHADHEAPVAAGIAALRACGVEV